MAIGINSISTKPFNQLANRELHFSFTFFTILFCLLLMAIITLLAGMYPAVVLSGFKPIEVLKGKLNIGHNMGIFRKALIVGQFVASIVMIIGTFTVGRQLHYLQTKDLGYNKEHVVIVLQKRTKDGNQLAQLFKNAIRKILKLWSFIFFIQYGRSRLDEPGVHRQ